MPKRLLLIAIESILLIMALGCATSITSNATPIITETTASTEDSDLTVPDDFYIIYEFGFVSPNNLRTILNTRSDIIGKITGYATDYSAIYYRIPRKDLQALYNAVVEYDIKLYSNPNLLTDEMVIATGRRFFRLTFCLSGEDYSVFWDNTINPHAFGVLFDLAYEIERYVSCTDAYVSLPSVTRFPPP